MGLKIDYEKSINILGFENLEIVDSSYETLYNLIKINEDKIRKGRYKIAYGYVISNTNLSFRHCFLIDVITDKIIDVSCKKFMDSFIDSKRYRYEVFTEFKCIEEYFFAVKFSTYMARETEKTLQRLLQDEENNFLKSMKKQQEEEKLRFTPVIIAV